jgi:hypothetical protein
MLDINFDVFASVLHYFDVFAKFVPRIVGAELQQDSPPRENDALKTIIKCQ